jgi:hypothetical protein
MNRRTKFQTGTQGFGYRNYRRLGDVMALIQILSLTEKTNRSENGLQKDLQQPPSTASTWTELAREHPEFFRVRAENPGDPDAQRISLVARAVMPRRADNKRDPMPSDLVGKLLDVAITLHDRETARRERWKSFIPVAGAIIAGLFAVAAAVMKIDRVPSQPAVFATPASGGAVNTSPTPPTRPAP